MDVVQEDVGSHPVRPYSLCARRSDEGWRRVTWLSHLWNVVVETFFEDSCVQRIEIPDGARAEPPAAPGTRGDDDGVRPAGSVPEAAPS